MAERVGSIVEGCVLEAARKHGVRAARGRLESDTQRIRKRLGGGRTDGVIGAMRQAEEAGDWFEPCVHRWWVQTLLEHYYDRLYAKARARLDRPVAFAGDAEAVAGYLLAAGA